MQIILGAEAIKEIFGYLLANGMVDNSSLSYMYMYLPMW